MKAQLIIFSTIAFLLTGGMAFGQMNATTDILSEIPPYGNGVNPAGPKPRTQTVPKTPMPEFNPVQEDQFQSKGASQLKTNYSPAEVEKKLIQSGFKVYNGSVISNGPSIWIPMELEDNRYTLCLDVSKTKSGSTIQLKRVYPERSHQNMADYGVFLDSLKQALN